MSKSPKVKIVGNGAIRIAPSDIVHSTNSREQMQRTFDMVKRLQDNGQWRGNPLPEKIKTGTGD